MGDWEEARTGKNLPLPPPSRFSRVQLCATPRTAAYQASLSMGLSRQEQEWVAISFSREESPRGVQIQEALVIGHIAGKIQTSLAVGPTSPHPCCSLLSREKKSSHILLHSQIRKQYHPNDVCKKMKTIFPSDQHCYLRHFLFP